MKDQLVDIREHCFRLASVLACLELTVKQPRARERDENVTLLDAHEWMQVASSVVSVDVVTGRFDDSIAYCENIWKFEAARSELLSRFITELICFSFTWGSFELVAKLIDPPKIPKSLHVSSSLVDRTIFFLKSQYEPMQPVVLYNTVLDDLRQILNAIPRYDDLSGQFEPQLFIGAAGVGLHVVRRIRNKLAHGALEMPLPEAWSLTQPLDVELIEISTRVLLLTIQMLLLAYYKDEHFAMDYLADDWSASFCGDVHDILKRLHVRA